MLQMFRLNCSQVSCLTANFSGSFGGGEIESLPSTLGFGVKE